MRTIMLTALGLLVIDGSLVSDSETQDRSLQTIPMSNVGGIPISRPFVVTTADRKRGLVFCSCAKCGSTSAFQFWYKAVYGHSFVWLKEPHTGFWVYAQQHNLWTPRLPTIPFFEFKDAVLSASATTYIALARNPVARYVSAFKSKVSCSKSKSAYGDGNVKVDDREGDRHVMVPTLLQLAAKGGATITPRSVHDDFGRSSCLDFDQFTLALEAVHRAGLAHRLDRHFLPQNFSLGACSGGMFMTPSEMATLTPLLVRTYDLHNTTMVLDHVSSPTEEFGISPSGLRRLCEISEPEMRWFGTAAPKEEAPYFCNKAAAP